MLYPHLTGTAILGIDTLWGGNVMSASGTGRFIADSWFSDEPLPDAYTHPMAARVRQSGGVTAPQPDRKAIDAYLHDIDIPGAIHGMLPASGATGLRAAYIQSLADCFEVMWDLAQEILGNGPAVSYQRCVQASTGINPTPSEPQQKLDLLAELLSKCGHATTTRDDLRAAVTAWRNQRIVPMASVATLGAAAIALYDKLSVANLVPRLPYELHKVPRANIEFLAIKDAWFSGSMNYLGRARHNDGTPQYEATYEINTSLEISVPEFLQLVSHEVVPGHVTTFAYLQNLHARGQVGFEASVLTMNTRAATLFEGIANNAILIAHNVTEISQLPDEDMQIGLLLALLQDDAKNHASYLTWGEGIPQPEVAATLRHEFLVSEERASKLSGAWGRHPLLGRMYLPAYRAGTEHVAELRRNYQPEQLLPVLYGCEGLVDIVTIGKALDQRP